jgi:hypothetical protein
MAFFTFCSLSVEEWFFYFTLIRGFWLILAGSGLKKTSTTFEQLKRKIDARKKVFSWRD